MHKLLHLCKQVVTRLFKSYQEIVRSACSVFVETRLGQAVDNS